MEALVVVTAWVARHWTTAAWLRRGWSRRRALHVSFASWRLAGVGSGQCGDCTDIDMLLRPFRFAEGRDAVTLNRCQNIRNRNEHRATNTAEANKAGGLPC